MLEHSCSNTIPALEKTTTTTKAPRHFLSLFLSLKRLLMRGCVQRGGFGCTTNGEKKKKKKKRERERERGIERGIDPIFLPRIFFLSLSLALEFRVTNTLDPKRKKKEKNIFASPLFFLFSLFVCAFAQARVRLLPRKTTTTNTNTTPLLRGGLFCVCVCPNDVSKGRERDAAAEKKRWDARLENSLSMMMKTR